MSLFCELFCRCLCQSVHAYACLHGCVCLELVVVCVRMSVCMAQYANKHVGVFVFALTFPRVLWSLIVLVCVLVFVCVCWCV